MFECPFPRVPEWGMPQVVPQSDCLGQLLVEPQGRCDGAGNLADLERMGQTGAVMVAFR